MYALCYSTKYPAQLYVKQIVKMCTTFSQKQHRYLKKQQQSLPESDFQRRPQTG